MLNVECSWSSYLLSPALSSFLRHEARKTFRGFVSISEDFNFARFQQGDSVGYPTKTRSLMLLQTGFGEVDVPLNAAQHFVVDDVLVAQRHNRRAFRFQRFAREPFVFGGEQSQARSGTVRVGAFELADVVFVFNPQALERVGLDGIVFGNFIEPRERSLVGFQAAVA